MISSSVLEIESPTNSPSARREEEQAIPRVAICDAYPVTIEGLRTIISRKGCFSVGPTATTLLGALQILQNGDLDILLVGASLRLHEIVGHQTPVGSAPGIFPSRVRIVVLGPSFSLRERASLLHGGVRGLLNREAQPDVIEDCLRTVVEGGTWIEGASSGGDPRQDQMLRGLTTRELQVLGLAARGLTNKAISAELGVSPGTIKLHMRHIFDKTGVRGRSALIIRHLSAHGSGSASTA